MKSIYYFIFVILTSCSIHGSFQGLFGYYHKTKKSGLEMVKLREGEVCAPSNDSAKVVIMNGLQLGNCLMSKEKSLIYIWAPNCHGRHCYSLDHLQKLCNNKHVELYVVAEYYDYTKMNSDHYAENKIIGIDTKYYRTNLTEKYLEYFIKDLLNGKDIKGTFYLFDSGKFVEAFMTLDDIKLD